MTRNVGEEARRGLKGHWGVRALWRVAWRGARVTGVIAWSVVELLVRRPETRLARAQWSQTLCGRLMRDLGVAIEMEGEFPRAGAVITNHQGYLDILVLASLAPCVFVSKAEVARWPVVGWITTMAGTVYIERGRGGSGAAAASRLREAVTDDLPVVFFPEGTTSNGVGLLPFHGGILSEGRAAGMGVTVGVLRYTLGGPPGATVEDDLAYWGDRGMLEHIVRFLTLESVRAWVHFASAPICFTTEDRKTAAAEAHTIMLELAAGALARDPGGEQEHSVSAR